MKKIWIMIFISISIVTVLSATPKKYESGKIWAVKKLLYLNEEPDVYSDSIFEKWLKNNEYEYVTIIENKVIKDKYNKKWIKVKYKNFTGYIHTKNLYKKKSEIESLNNKYSKNASLPNYKRYINLKYLEHDRSYDKKIEVANAGETHLCSLKRLQAVRHKPHEHGVVSKYVVEPVWIESDPRHLFVLLSKANPIGERGGMGNMLENRTIKKIYPVKIDKSKYGVTQIMTTQIVTYKNRPAANLVVLVEYKDSDQFEEAKLKKIYGNPVKAWRFNKRRIKLKALSKKELRYVKCRLMIHEDLPEWIGSPE